jgi:3-dehydroquinate synthase class II
MPHDDLSYPRTIRHRIVTTGTDTVVPISRAVNVSVEQAQVVAMCKKHDAIISAIETLPSGGTRVVLMNSADAAKIIKAFGSKVLTGTVARTHWMRAV